jgi:hypothetical protein
MRPYVVVADRPLLLFVLPCHSYVRCHFVQLVVLQSFQNGRDTRIRHLRVFGPRSWSNQRGALNDLTTMTSVEFRQHAQIR